MVLEARRVVNFGEGRRSREGWGRASGLLVVIFTQECHTGVFALVIFLCVDLIPQQDVFSNKKDNGEPSKKWLRKQWKNQQAIESWWKSFDLRDAIVKLRAANIC